jgi:hypothetical protein
VCTYWNICHCLGAIVHISDASKVVIVHVGLLISLCKIFKCLLVLNGFCCIRIYLNLKMHGHVDIGP